MFRRPWGPLCREFSAFPRHHRPSAAEPRRRPGCESRSRRKIYEPSAVSRWIPEQLQARRSRMAKEHARASVWFRCKHAQSAGSVERSRFGKSTKGRGDLASLFANGLGCGPAPPRACQLSASAPALTSGASRMSADRPKAIPEPSNPPSAPRISFRAAFHRAASSEAHARQAANPRHTDFAARPHMLLTTHVSRHELMPFVSVVRWRGLCEQRGERGQVLAGSSADGYRCDPAKLWFRRRVRASMEQKSRRPPWKRTNPRKNAGQLSKKLTPAQKAEAKKRAERAGRPYPNLIDNMTVAKQHRKT